MRPLSGPVTITDQADTPSAGRAGLVIGLTLVLLGVGLCFIPSIAGKIIGVVVGLIGLLWLWTYVSHRRQVRRLDAGNLTLASAPLVMGAPFALAYARGIKRGSREAQHLTAELRLQEWVRYQVGNDTRTITATVWSTPLHVELQSHPSGLAATFRGTIPPITATFKARDNRTTWHVFVAFVLTDGFEEDSLFEVPVAPACVAAVAT